MWSPFCSALAGALAVTGAAAITFVVTTQSPSLVLGEEAAWCEPAALPAVPSQRVLGAAGVLLFAALLLTAFPRTMVERAVSAATAASAPVALLALSAAPFRASAAAFGWLWSQLPTSSTHGRWESSQPLEATLQTQVLGEWYDTRTRCGAAMEAVFAKVLVAMAVVFLVAAAACLFAAAVGAQAKARSHRAEPAPPQVSEAPPAFTPPPHENGDFASAGTDQSAFGGPKLAGTAPHVAGPGGLAPAELMAPGFASYAPTYPTHGGGHGKRARSEAGPHHRGGVGLHHRGGGGGGGGSGGGGGGGGVGGAS